jgi:ComF family protein
LPATPLRRLADGILNLLYPESCLVCSAPVARLEHHGICPACWQKAMQLRITGPCCPLCGLPYRSFEDESTHLCGKCTLRMPPYSGARAFGCYSSELSRMVQALKFDGRRDLAALLAPLLASTFLETWSPQEMDVVVPVPLHARRRRERGYNQAALLGRALARALGLRFSADALIRVRGTVPQVGLSDSERVHNVERAFRCARPEEVNGKRILLVDDVMTTGSTIASASEAVLLGGALRVSVITVARAVMQ